MGQVRHADGPCCGHERGARGFWRGSKALGMARKNDDRSALAPAITVMRPLPATLDRAACGRVRLEQSNYACHPLWAEAHKLGYDKFIPPDELDKWKPA